MPDWANRGDFKCVECGFDTFTFKHYEEKEDATLRGQGAVYRHTYVCNRCKTEQTIHVYDPDDGS